MDYRIRHYQTPFNPRLTPPTADAMFQGNQFIYYNYVTKIFL